MACVVPWLGWAESRHGIQASPRPPARSIPRPGALGYLSLGALLRPLRRPRPPAHTFPWHVGTRRKGPEVRGGQILSRKITTQGAGVAMRAGTFRCTSTAPVILSGLCHGPGGGATTAKRKIKVWRYICCYTMHACTFLALRRCADLPVSPPSAWPLLFLLSQMPLLFWQVGCMFSSPNWRGAEWLLFGACCACAGDSGRG